MGKEKIDSKQSQSTLQDLFKTLSQEYYFDMHIPNYKVINERFNLEQKIQNTKELYCKYHPNFDIKSFNKVPMHFLKEIVKNDSVIYLDDTLILKELYKIIYLIDMTNNINDFIKTKKYERHLKANKNITTQMNSHRKYLLVGSSPISYRGEHRLNWHFLNNFKKEKKITKFFLEAMVLKDIEKISGFYEMDEDKIIQILTFYENRLIQRTNQKAVLKSLGILLHYEFKYYLNIGDNDSQKLVVDIMSNIYDTKVNDDEFNRKIYLASTVSFNPIFAAKKNNHFLNKEKTIIRNLLIKDMRIQNPKMKIDYKVIDMFLEQHLKTQHLDYLGKYPSELLKINEKYSHLKSLN